MRQAAVRQLAEHSSIPFMEFDAFAVDEEAPAAVEQAGLGIEPHQRAAHYSRRRAPAAPGAKHHVRLRLAQVFAEETLDVAPRPADAREKSFSKINHLLRQFAGPPRRREPRVAVLRVGQAAAVQPVEERRAELGATRGAKADRISEAVLERDAVVP